MKLAAASTTGKDTNSLGHTGQRGPQRGQGVSGPRPAARCVRESRVRSQVVGESADGRIQLRGYALRGSAGAEQIADHGRAEEVDNHEPVNIRDLEKNSEAIKVVGPFSIDTFPDAAIQEVGRRYSALFHQHRQSGGRQPLVNEEWHAMRRAIHRGVEGAGWDNLYFKFVEMNKEVNVRHPSGSGKTKMLC